MMIYKYFGINIYRNFDPGYALRYTATLDSGTRLTADTLSGIKAMIKDFIKA